MTPQDGGPKQKNNGRDEREDQHTLVNGHVDQVQDNSDGDVDDDDDGNNGDDHVDGNHLFGPPRSGPCYRVAIQYMRPQIISKSS